MPSKDATIKITDWKKLADFIYFRGEDIGLMRNIEVARACGMNVQQINKLDNGEIKSMFPGTVERLCTGLKMSKCEFMEKAGLVEG